MNRRTAIGFGWTVGWLVCLLTAVLLYNELTLAHCPALLLSLPALFGAGRVWFPALQPDGPLLTPKNIALFVWFNKLVIIPVMLLVAGNRVAKFERLPSPLIWETAILSMAFLTFWVGCQGYENRHRLIISQPKEATRQPISIWFSVAFLAVGFWALLYQFGSLAGYGQRAILKISAETFNREMTGNVLGFAATLGARFLPFGVLAIWAGRSPVTGWHWKNGLALLACGAASLSSNRANLLYPTLAMLAVMLAGQRVRHKAIFLIPAMPLLAGVFFFSLIRSQTTFAIADVPVLAGAFWRGLDSLVMVYQLYFGSLYQLTPVLTIDPALTDNTLLSSLLYSVPGVGRGFRETSGVIAYNAAIYGSVSHPDQVIPVAGEFFFNAGLPGVAASHLAIGAGFCWLNRQFSRAVSNGLSVEVGCWFYLALLYNALILLSLSVFVQFLIFMAPPALLLLVLSGKRARLA